MTFAGNIPNLHLLLLFKLGKGRQLTLLKCAIKNNDMVRGYR